MENLKMLHIRDGDELVRIAFGNLKGIVQI